MSFCLSLAIPMPVSRTSIAKTLCASPRTGWSADQPDATGATRITTSPCDVNLNAFESKFFKICCSRLGSLVKARGRAL